jgi:hypothetical protein
MGLLSTLFPTEKERCARQNHPSATIIDEMRSDKHPQADADFDFKVELWHCPHCKATFTREGLGCRGGVQAFLERGAPVRTRPA